MISLRTLLEQFKAGDPSAFEHLYLDYSPKAYRFTKRYVCHNEDAEEIVQDVFIRLWETRDTIDPDQNFDNYLFTITRNLIFNRYRAKVNEQHYKTAILASVEQEYDQLEEEVVAQDLSQYIDDIVSQFPPKQQEVFNMSRKQMLSHKEIAEKLGIAEKTVRAHIYQVLSKIRLFLEKNGVNFIFFLLLTKL